MEKLKVVISTCCLGIVYFFNSLSMPLILLIISNIFDIITGLLKSIYIKDKITFKKIFWGLIKKLSMYVLIIIGFIIDLLIIYTVENLNIFINIKGIFGSLLAIWLILDELSSILRNLIILKIPMPNFIINLIKKLKKTIDDNGNI